MADPTLRPWESRALQLGWSWYRPPNTTEHRWVHRATGTIAVVQRWEGIWCYSVGDITGVACADEESALTAASKALGLLEDEHA